MTIDRTTIVSRASGIHSAKISDHELVLLGNEYYLGLDDPGIAIWDQLEQPKSIGEIIDSLAAIYDVDIDVLEKDILIFVEQLLNEGALQAQS